jgi:hypothetical protein
MAASHLESTSGQQSVQLTTAIEIKHANSIETAYRKADDSIQQILDLLAA